MSEKVKGKQREELSALDADAPTTTKKEKRRKSRKSREQVEHSVSDYKPILTIKSCQGFVFNQASLFYRLSLDVPVLTCIR